MTSHDPQVATDDLARPTDDAPGASTEPSGGVTAADDVVSFDDVPLGRVDAEGNVLLLATPTSPERVIGHIGNDRDGMIAILRDRYFTWLGDIDAFIAANREDDHRLWRIHDIDRMLSEIDQQCVLGDLTVGRERLLAFRQDLAEQQHAKIAARDALITEAESLAESSDWKATGIRFDELNAAYKAIGSVGDRRRDQDDWQRLKTPERAFRTRRKADLATRDAEFGRRAAAKEVICIAAEDLAAGSEFRYAAQRLRDLAAEWKEIGFSGRERDDELWTRFNAARDAFSAGRSGWQSDNKQKKDDVAGRAERLAELHDASAARKQMKVLMDEWREIGTAGKSADESLWKRFRAAQQTVHERSQEQFSERQRQREDNASRKEALIAEAERLADADSRQATARAKELQAEWKTIGPVPRELSDDQWSRFRAACDAIFRVAQVASKRRQQDAHDRGVEHIQKLSAEIDEHERKIAHWEGVIANLRQGPQAEEIRANMEEKIATAKERIQLKLGWIEEHYARISNHSGRK